MREYFSFTQAERLLREGERVTRAALRGKFVMLRGGEPCIGSYIGETSLGSARPYAFTDEDRAAADWERFTREKPAPWEGCDAG